MVKDVMNLKNDEKYTVWEYSMGYPSSYQIRVIDKKILDVSQSSYQYKSLARIYFKRKGCRKIDEKMIYPDTDIIIWPGWVNPDTEMYIKYDNGNRCAKGFDREYIKRAIKSIEIKPAFIIQNY